MYSRIVVGTDGSDRASRAVTHAVDLAALSGAELHLVSAGNDLQAIAAAGAAGLPSAGDLDPNRTPNQINDALSKAVKVAQSKGVESKTHAVSGEPVEALCGIADKVEADLLVVGNRGMQGVQRYFWDSVPDAVSHKASCSVLIVDTRDK